ncbi:MAG: DUF2127 domain-containing protein [Isosphaeraceae bacterium]
MEHPHRHRHAGLKVIGVLKLVSGVTALAVGLGAFRYLGHDPGPQAERVVSHLGLDPHNRVIHEIVSWITGIDRTHLREIEFGTFFYAALHTVEGLGLILGYHWAEYLVIVATGSLVPFEMYEIMRKFTAVRVGLFLGNLEIVVYLVWMLTRQQRERAGERA